MKPIRPSNWKAKRRVLYTLVLGVTALWAMPECARAQLYVSQSTTNTVGKYDAATGAVINANFITGDINPIGLALSGDGTALFVASNSTGTVGKYNASTGAAINANFITTGPTTNGNFITRGSGPTGLAVSGNDLFVGGFPFQGPPFTVALPGEGLGTVSKYDATMGVTINANFITGLDIGPQLAVAPTPPLPTPTKELVWENTVTGEHSICVMQNGVPTKVISLPTSPIQWGIAAAAHFPKTGEADLVWENAVTGEHTIWILNKGVPLSSTKLPTIFTEWEIVD